MRRQILLALAVASCTAACGSPSSSSPSELLAPSDSPRDDASQTAGGDTSGDESTGSAKTPGKAPASGDKSSPKPADGPCFATAQATKVTSFFDNEDKVGKMLVVGSRLAFMHGGWVSTMPIGGGSSQGVFEPVDFMDIAVATGDDRIYTLNPDGITYTKPLSGYEETVSAYTSGAVGLYVDDQYVYFTARLGGTTGFLERHFRDDVGGLPGDNIAEQIGSGAFTRWIGGTSDRVFVVTHADDGATSGGAVFSMPKPGGDFTALGSFTNAAPSGFVVDETGIVVATSGQYGNGDEIDAAGLDGSNITALVERPHGALDHLAADASHVYFVTSGTHLERVPRAGGAAAETVATSTCSITAVMTDASGVYVATKHGTDSEIWRFAK